MLQNLYPIFILCTKLNVGYNFSRMSECPKRKCHVYRTCCWTSIRKCTQQQCSCFIWKEKESSWDPWWISLETYYLNYHHYNSNELFFLKIRAGALPNHIRRKRSQGLTDKLLHKSEKLSPQKRKYMDNYETRGFPHALKHRSVSSLISCTTTNGSASLPSKVRRFLSFHKFHTVYISTAAFVLLCYFGRCCRVVIHQSSMGMSKSGLRTRSWDHDWTSTQTCCA